MPSSFRRRYLALIADSLRPRQLPSAETLVARLAVAPVGTALDAADSARVLAMYRGLPVAETPALARSRQSISRRGWPYVWDEVSGLVYIVD